MRHKRTNHRRPAVHAPALADALRARIVNGTWHPGERLPTRRELMKAYERSSITVQRALDELREQGFVEAKRPAGTFVSPRPPHLHRFALVFASGTGRATLFEQALTLAGEAIGAANERDIVPYLYVDGHTEYEHYRQLLHDVTSPCLAGVIYACALWPLADTPLLQRSKVPAVAVSSSPSNGLPAVYPDSVALADTLVTAAVSRGARRAAVLTSMGDELNRRLADRAARAGLNMPATGVIRMPPLAGNTVEDVVRLLLAAPPAQAPDTLLLTDDHFLAPTLKALDTYRGGVGRTVRVTSLWNLPVPPPVRDGLTLVAFDARKLLAACFALLRNGRHPHAGETLVKTPPEIIDAAEYTEVAHASLT